MPIRNPLVPDAVALFRNVLLLALGGFFLLFGIHVLIMAYRLDDPFSFVLTFFASNLIILISAVLMIGFGLRIRSRWKSVARSIAAGRNPVPAEEWRCKGS